MTAWVVPAGSSAAVSPAASIAVRTGGRAAGTHTNAPAVAVSAATGSASNVVIGPP
jgi:hypothetical protein